MLILPFFPAAVVATLPLTRLIMANLKAVFGNINIIDRCAELFCFEK